MASLIFTFENKFIEEGKLNTGKVVYTTSLSLSDEMDGIVPNDIDKIKFALHKIHLDHENILTENDNIWDIITKLWESNMSGVVDFNKLQPVAYDPKRTIVNITFLKSVISNESTIISVSEMVQSDRYTPNISLIVTIVFHEDGTIEMYDNSPNIPYMNMKEDKDFYNPLQQ